MDYAIEVENLSKTYENVKALDNVSLQLPKGACLAVIGENGSGKSTLINIIASIVKPSNGSAKIFNKSCFSVDAKKERGIVFQEHKTSLFLTGEETLTIQGMLYGLSKKESKKKASELMQFVGLEEHAKDAVQTYSAGMKRRLEIAKGLVHNPKILLLDEPTGDLDVGIRQKIWKHINDLRKNYNLTVLLSTHDMNEALELADEILVLKNGKVILIEEKKVIGKTKTAIVIESKNINAVGKKAKELKWKIKEIDKNKIVIFSDKSKEEVNKQIFKLFKGINIKNIEVKDFELSDFIIWWQK